MDWKSRKIILICSVRNPYRHCPQGRKRMSYCLRMNRRSASGSVTEASAMAGFLILCVPEDPAEKKADERPAEHDLPEESHREILRHSRKPGWYEIHESRLVEYECGLETHDGTHHRYCHSCPECSSHNRVRIFIRIARRDSGGYRVCDEE